MELCKCNCPNVTKYLSDLTDGQECQIFKSEEAFNEASGDKVCYIGDYGVQDLLEFAEREEDLTDAEIISRGIGASRNSIIAEIKAELKRQKLKATTKQVRELAECAFGEADWTYISTVIDQWDLEEMLEE